MEHEPHQRARHVLPADEHVHVARPLTFGMTVVGRWDADDDASTRMYRIDDVVASGAAVRCDPDVDAVADGDGSDEPDRPAHPLEVEARDPVPCGDAVLDRDVVVLPERRSHAEPVVVEVAVLDGHP